MSGRAVAEVLLGVTDIEATYFIASYGLRSNWRSTIVGRSMWWLAFSFWLLVTWILVSFFVSRFPWRDDVRGLLFLFFAAMFARMDYTLWKVQRAERGGRALEDLSELDDPR